MSCYLGVTMRQVSGRRIPKHATDVTYVQYLYNVLKGQSSLPEEALAMIRYHSFYP